MSYYPAMATETERRHVGEAIKARRSTLQLTQAELCERLGWDRRRISDISQIESGERANLTVESLRLFAAALNFSVADLVDGLSAGEVR